MAHILSISQLASTLATLGVASLASSNLAAGPTTTSVGAVEVSHALQTGDDKGGHGDKDKDKDKTPDKGNKKHPKKGGKKDGSCGAKGGCGAGSCG